MIDCFELTPLRKLKYVLTDFLVPVYPVPLSPPASSTAHFSAADFFRDAPWLNIPAHRKADILVEPLYPRLGLLGGAPENSGKVSKLAALAAARKKKEGEKSAAPTPTPPSEVESSRPSSTERKSPALSLRERLASNGKPQKSSEGLQSLRSLNKGSRLGSPSPQKMPSPEPRKQSSPEVTGQADIEPPVSTDKKQEEQAALNIRAPPSTFASTIVGEAIRPKMAEPSHLSASTLDLIKIYGQELAEPFDFAGPSPDDVVLNAQSSAKGLAIRRKI